MARIWKVKPNTRHANRNKAMQDRPERGYARFVFRKKGEILNDIEDERSSTRQ